MAVQTEDELLEEVTGQEYKYGFTTDIEMDTAPMGLSEEIVRFISAKKDEPQWEGFFSKIPKIPYLRSKWN